MSKAIRAATGKLQQDMDVLGGFLTECCVFDRDAQSTAKDLYGAYCAWAEANGEKPLSQRWFGLRLSERGTCESVRTRTGKLWVGIGLISQRSIHEEGGNSVNDVHLVSLDSRKSHTCAHVYMNSFGEVASQGSHGSQQADEWEHEYDPDSLEVG